MGSLEILMEKCSIAWQDFSKIVHNIEEKYDLFSAEELLIEQRGLHMAYETLWGFNDDSIDAMEEDKGTDHQEEVAELKVKGEHCRKRYRDALQRLRGTAWRITVAVQVGEATHRLDIALEKAKGLEKSEITSADRCSRMGDQLNIAVTGLSGIVEKWAPFVPKEEAKIICECVRDYDREVKAHVRALERQIRRMGQPCHGRGGPGAKGEAPRSSSKVLLIMTARQGGDLGPTVTFCEEEPDLGLTVTFCKEEPVALTMRATGIAEQLYDQRTATRPFCAIGTEALTTAPPGSSTGGGAIGAEERRFMIMEEVSASVPATLLLAGIEGEVGDAVVGETMPPVCTSQAETAGESEEVSHTSVIGATSETGGGGNAISNLRGPEAIGGLCATSGHPRSSTVRGEIPTRVAPGVRMSTVPTHVLEEFLNAMEGVTGNTSNFPSLRKYLKAKWRWKGRVDGEKHCPLTPGGKGVSDM